MPAGQATHFFPFQSGLLSGHLQVLLMEVLPPVHSHTPVKVFNFCGALHGFLAQSQLLLVELKLVPVGHDLHCLVTGSKKTPESELHLTQ